jgi:hypothetical protein
MTDKGCKQNMYEQANCGVDAQNDNMLGQENHA